MKPRQIYYRQTLILPDHLADWDVWEYWEMPRTDSIAANFTPGAVLYDIGAEHGALSAVYATSGWAMVLVEPSPDFWPNIRLTWEHNGLPEPRACHVGLLGSAEIATEADFVEGTLDGRWPLCAVGDVECPARPYRYLHNEKHAVTTPTTTLDELVTRLGIPPDGVTIDVEGAELEVLRGASRTLTEVRPLVWVSVHPDLLERDYGGTPDMLNTLMTGYDYLSAHLATDHEEHHFWYPAERAAQVVLPAGG